MGAGEPESDPKENTAGGAAAPALARSYDKGGLLLAGMGDWKGPRTWKEPPRPPVLGGTARPPVDRGRVAEPVLQEAREGLLLGSVVLSSAGTCVADG